MITEHLCFQLCVEWLSLHWLIVKLCDLYVMLFFLVYTHVRPHTFHLIYIFIIWNIYLYPNWYVSLTLWFLMFFSPNLIFLRFFFLSLGCFSASFLWHPKFPQIGWKIYSCLNQQKKMDNWMDGLCIKVQCRCGQFISPRGHIRNQDR